MSEVAGRMSVQEGAKYLERPQMGRGILLGGVPGVPPAHITILGGGVVGANAAKIAAGFQADVTILDAAAETSPPIARAINIHRGAVTNGPVAHTFGLPYDRRFDA